MIFFLLFSIAMSPFNGVFHHYPNKTNSETKEPTFKSNVKPKIII